MAQEFANKSNRMFWFLGNAKATTIKRTTRRQELLHLLSRPATTIAQSSISYHLLTKTIPHSLVQSLELPIHDDVLVSGARNRRCSRARLGHDVTHLLRAFNQYMFLSSELRDVFRMFDKDNSGSIDVHEIRSIIRSMGKSPPEAELRRMIRDVDKDGSGSIEFPEFVQMMYHYIGTGDNSSQELKEAFKVFDRNGDGEISFQGFTQYTNMSPCKYLWAFVSL